LFVGGSSLKIHYIKNDVEFFDPQPNLSLGWVEEKDKRTHYFLFVLTNASYVLRALYRPLNGLDTTLIKCNRPVDRDNFRTVPRWTKDVERIGGNDSKDPKVYRNVIVKSEGEGGGSVDIKLEIKDYADSELGEIIENPIAIELD